MPNSANNKAKMQRLQTISETLEAARDKADDMDAHLLAAKIEDSRYCAQEMIEELRR